MRSSLVEFGLYKIFQIDSPDKSGWTPLHVAASEGKLSSVELLLKFGANVNAKNVDGATPLHYFVR